LVRRGFTLTEAAQLLIFADVQPEFEQQYAMVAKLLLEVIDFRVGILPVLGRGEALDPFDQNPPIPAAVVQGDAAGTWQMAPESPEIMMGPFLIGRCRDLDHLTDARIDGTQKAPNGPAFACRIPSLEHQHHRD